MEATYDDVWGTGKLLGNVHCLNPTKWTSIGILGKILMRIRDSTYEGSTDTEDNDAAPMDAEHATQQEAMNSDSNQND